MKILNIIDCNMGFSGNMRNSVIDFSQMTTSVVAIITDVVIDGQPVIGYGFNSMGRYGQSGIIRTRFAPRILAAAECQLLNTEGTNFSAQKIFDIMMKNEKPGGHGDRAHAAGAIDMAVWDIISKIERKPLWKYLSETFNQGAYDDQVFCYGAGGYYYPDQGIEGLKSELQGYLEQGFDCIKIKIGGASLSEDLKRLEAAIQVAGFSRKVAVDANGKFNLDKAMEYAKALEPYSILWYEEPGDPNDYLLHSVLVESYSGSIATAENLFSVQDTKNMLLFGRLRPNKDIIQTDVNLAYGLTGAIQIIKMMDQMGWSRKQIYLHGGHLLCLHLAAAMQLGGSECYPGVFQPFGGFNSEVMLNNGMATLPESPGIGVEQKTELYQCLRELVRKE
ncbi:enolase C-terminal domain-like protein [Lacrimispora amygdalina]|uniref:enolase C-terminal domain-like protein n=1 Tax=Lacrimispora amygdalina TaxID=253257 RepID=UPI001A9A432C|nr:enolase C-terminal domain-like protein [Lacrimispora amygdalina]